jgi:hypothetical protein
MPAGQLRSTAFVCTKNIATLPSLAAANLFPSGDQDTAVKSPSRLQITFPFVQSSKRRPAPRAASIWSAAGERASSEQFTIGFCHTGHALVRSHRTRRPPGVTRKTVRLSGATATAPPPALSPSGSRSGPAIISGDGTQRSGATDRAAGPSTRRPTLRTCRLAQRASDDGTLAFAGRTCTHSRTSRSPTTLSLWTYARRDPSGEKRTPRFPVAPAGTSSTCSRLLSRHRRSRLAEFEAIQSPSGANATLHTLSSRWPEKHDCSAPSAAEQTRTSVFAARTISRPEGDHATSLAHGLLSWLS